MSLLESEIPRIDISGMVETPRYRAVGKNLIMLSNEPDEPFSDRVLDRVGASTLERPPEPEELGQFNTIIRVVPGTTGKDEDLKVQSIYTADGSREVTLGTLFPEIQPYLNNFQAMTGLLYPQKVSWRRDRIGKGQGGNQEGDNTLLESWLTGLEPKRVWQLTNLLSPRKQAKALESLLFPEDQTHRLGIVGLGDIGTYVASMIRGREIVKSGITDIFIGGSRTAEKVRAQGLELRQINIEGVRQPNVHEVLPGDEGTFFEECDILLILVAGEVPAVDVTNLDVRSEQFGKNIEIITEFLQRAEKKQYDGQILVASDPVEQLTMATFLKMKELNWDVANHQFAGFGGMINRSRAKMVADETKIINFGQGGRVFGPHGKMVVVIPSHDKHYFNIKQAEDISISTGHCNYRIREEGVKPYIGPAALITEGILEISSQESQRRGIIYASPFIPSDDEQKAGAFFGTRVKYHPFPGAWTPRVEQPPLDQVIEILKRAHYWTSITSQNPELLKTDPFTNGERDHPAFHPFKFETWMDLVMKRTD